MFNIGSDAEVTILDLARQVKHAVGSRSEIVFIPYEQAYEEGFEDMRRRVPDLSKIGLLTGFRPEIGLKRTLEEVAAYHRRRAPR